MTVLPTCTGILHVAWSRMGDQSGYQQFFSVAPTNRHSVCECTWLEEPHHSWKGTVAIGASESEPQAARCTWSPLPEMCLCLLWVPLKVRSLASLSQQEQRLPHHPLLLTSPSLALGFLHVAGDFPCVSHLAAVVQLVERQEHFAPYASPHRALSPVAYQIPTYSVCPLVAHFFFFSRRR